MVQVLLLVAVFRFRERDLPRRSPGRCGAARSWSSRGPSAPPWSCRDRLPDLRHLPTQATKAKDALRVKSSGSSGGGSSVPDLGVSTATTLSPGRPPVTSRSQHRRHPQLLGPALGGKRDALPGGVTPSRSPSTRRASTGASARSSADRPTRTWDCAWWCKDAARFAKWTAAPGASAPAVEPTGEPATAGKAALPGGNIRRATTRFAGCQAGVPRSRPHPLREPPHFAGSMLPNTPQNLGALGAQRAGDEARPVKMPAFRRSRTSRSEALTAYLSSLKFKMADSLASRRATFPPLTLTAAHAPRILGEPAFSIPG